MPMRLKEREAPLDLKKMEYLNWRKGLSHEDQLLYLNKEKGFEGEVKFDRMLDQLPDSSYLILDDLLLEHKNNEFQLDTTLIYQNRLHFFEIKNFEGDFIVEKEKWFTVSGKEINNPIHQMQRSIILLKDLLQSFGREFVLPIESHVVFVNPEFSLFQAPKDSPIILPGQIHRFLKNLSKITTHPQPVHYKLADKLKSLHLLESQNQKKLNYSYDKIQKGIHCAICHGMLTEKSHGKIICKSCGYEELVEFAVIRMVEEFIILFPELLVTVSVISEWCGGMINIRIIYKVLVNNYQIANKGRFSYYLVQKLNNK